MIPKLIHQIFITDESDPVDLDNETIANTKSWRLFHARYKYKLWNIGEIRSLAGEFDSRILAAIDACTLPAMKADIARLMILFLQGGIYVDLKLRCLRHFIDEFCEYKLILFEHWDGRTLINGFIIAEAQHEFIRRALQDCVNNVEARRGTGVWTTTGPGVLMRLRNEFLPEKCDQFEDGVGVVRGASEKLFTSRGGGYNKFGRHWHEREQIESIYTDCDARYRKPNRFSVLLNRMWRVALHPVASYRRWIKR